MALIGYARVSTAEQNEARHIEQFRKMGIDEDCIFIDKCSGKNENRPQLAEMRKYIRKGDTLIVTEYSRLARSTTDLLNIIKELTDKGADVQSIKESFDTTTPQGKLMLTIFAGLAEFEREMILQRQREGIRIAKAEGKYKGRRETPYNEKSLRSECEKWRNKQQTAIQTMKILGMKPNRFYRLVKKLGL